MNLWWPIVKHFKFVACRKTANATLNFRSVQPSRYCTIVNRDVQPKIKEFVCRTGTYMDDDPQTTNND